MKTKNIFYQPGENKISLSQTSKGSWYCSELSIYCKDIFDGISLADGAMEAIETLLHERNKASIQGDKDIDG